MKRSRGTGMLLALMILLASVVSGSSARAATGSVPYIDFNKQTASADFAGSALAGVTLADVAGQASIKLASTGLRTGSDKKLYKRTSYQYGTLESPVVDAARPFDRAVGSWNPVTPAGTWIQVELRAYRPAGNYWTKYYNMGIWASGTATIRRQSVNGQGDADGFVSTDSLLLNSNPAAYTKYQYKLTLFRASGSTASPTVRLMSVMTSDSSKEAEGLSIASDRQAWGTDLNVPMRSQMIYKGGGPNWCSPTSTSMVLAYWGRRVPVPAAAAATYDYVYNGFGNWPFNTAWAASYPELTAYVTRMGSFAQVEEWISAGVPVIMSFAFGVGELPGTPIRSSAGHIMVVRGFEADGDVIVNDPAASADARVRIVYDRATLERLWLKHSSGTVYLIYPKGHRVPTDKANGSW